MRSTAFCTAFVLLASLASVEAQEAERTIEVVLQVPSTAYKLQIQEVYQTAKELWVLSRVEGKGIGAQVITTRKDQVKIKAPADSTVKHYVLGKTWNWGDEPYKFLKNRAEFEKLAKEAMAKKIYERPAQREKKAEDALYIIMYHKEIFTNGKTKDNETLEQLAHRHAKEFNGQVKHIFQIINGCALQLSAENAARLAKLPEVRSVEKDQ